MIEGKLRGRRRFSPAIAIATVAIGTLGPRPARAEPTIEADLEAGTLLSQGAALGGAASLGYAIRGTQWLVVPEARFGYMKVNDAYSRNIMRVGGGARLGFVGAISPSLSAHVGYGEGWGTDYDAVLRQTGPSVEAGGSVSFAISRHVALGPRIGVGTIVGHAGWLVGGLQLVVGLGAGAPDVAAPVTAQRD